MAINTRDERHRPFLSAYTRLAEGIEESEVTGLVQEFWELRERAMGLGLMPESYVKNHRIRHTGVKYEKSFIKKLAAHWGIKLNINKVSKEEAQRARAWVLFDEGMNNSAIARDLGVARLTVIRWKKKYQSAP